MTGSNTNSNAVFGALQRDAALLLGLSVPWVLALQTASGALSSMLAPAKILVGMSTVGLRPGDTAGAEGQALRPPAEIRRRVARGHHRARLRHRRFGLRAVRCSGARTANGRSGALTALPPARIPHYTASMANPRPLRIGILGAGAAGLAAAWDIARAGHHVECYEAAPQVGGLAAGFREPEWDWSLEKFYHHWFTNDDDALRLIEEIGARDRLRILRPKTRVWIDGAAYRTEISPASLRLPLSPIALVRMALAVLYLKFTRNWRALEGITADRWLRRWLGAEAYERLFRPLLIGKFADEYDRVNMAWLWARTVKRTARLATFAGGFQAFNEALAAAVTEQGARIHLNTPVQSFQYRDGQPTLQLADGPETLRPRAHHRLAAPVVAPGAHPGGDGLWRAAPLVAQHGRRLRDLFATGAADDRWHLLALRYRPIAPTKRVTNSPSSCSSSTRISSTAPISTASAWCIVAITYRAITEYFQLSEEELLARFRSALVRVNPNFRPEWLRQLLALPHTLRPARARPPPQRQYPQYRDAIAGPVLGEHEPGLPLGPRHQLRHRAGAPRGRPSCWRRPRL